MQVHDHLVHIDEATRELLVYRVNASGEKSLFTSAILPGGDSSPETVRTFAQTLGENLLLDSPVARRILRLGA